MRKTKILYLNDFGDLGGTQKILLYVAKILDRSKYEMEFLFGSPGEIYEEVMRLGFTTYLLPLPHLVPWNRSKLLVPLNFLKFLRPFIKLVLLLRNSDVDLVVTNSIKFEIIGSVAAKLTRKRLWWHTHNIQPRGFRRWFIRWLAGPLPERIIAVSEAVKESYRGSNAYSKISVVGNGIERSLLPNTSKRENGRFRVLMLSMLTEWKGHRVLIDALNDLEKSGNLANIEVIVAGEPHSPKDEIFARDLIQNSESLTRKHVVRFIGKVQEVEHYLQKGDILVNLSTLPDPYPTVLLEAFGQGVPVIATNIGGQAEIVTHQQTGILIEPNNAKELSRAILYCKSNPDELSEFSKECLSTFERDFTLESFGKRYMNVLNRFLRN